MPSNTDTMERMRADLLRRARTERREDIEHGWSHEAVPECQESHLNGTGIFSRSSRTRITRFFGRSGEAAIAHMRGVEPLTQTQSPKSPVFNSYIGDFFFNRFHLYQYSRACFGNSSGQHAQLEPDEVETSFAARPDMEVFNVPVLPEPHTQARSTVRAPSSFYSSSELFTNSDQVSDSNGRSHRSLGQRERRNRRHRHRQSNVERGNRRKQHGKEPKRFLFFFPWVKSKTMRTYIVRCFVSGLFLILLLSIYLGLSVSNSINMGEFTIVLILVVVLATLFFSFGLAKLCLLVIRRDRAKHSRVERAQNNLNHHYAIPREPIQVLLARDEEAAGIESETSKITPPAYGVWRESVRVDPDRLYWQRNENVDTREIDGRPQTSASRRPPSYISDDGVSYVVDAAQRSVAPSLVSWPTHPLEAENLARIQSPQQVHFGEIRQ